MNIGSLKKSLFIIFFIVFILFLVSNNINYNDSFSLNNSNNEKNIIKEVKENNIIIEDEKIIENNKINKKRNYVYSNSNNHNIENINNKNNINSNNNNVDNNINNFNIDTNGNSNSNSNSINKFNYNNDNSNSNSNSINSNKNSNSININNEDDKTIDRYYNDESDDESNESLSRSTPIKTYISKEEAERRRIAKIEKIKKNEINTKLESLILSNYTIDECRKEINYIIKYDMEPDIASIKEVPGYQGPRLPYDNKSKYLETHWKLKSVNNSILLPRPHIFIHMPKTGGTSLLKVFRANNRGYRFYHNTQHPTYDELDEIISKKNTLFGHFKFGLHKYYDENEKTKLNLPDSVVESYLNPYSYLTMLRDPIERVISHYYFLKESKSHPLHKETIDRSFIEWISISEVTHNELCRRIVGIDRSQELPEDFEQLCIHRLKYTFKYIGIMERFDESIVLLSHKLGYTQLLFPLVNVGQIKNLTTETLKPEELSLIKRLNHADIKAYQIALELFEKEIDMIGRDFFNEEVEHLKNHYIDRYGPVETLYINDSRRRKRKFQVLNKIKNQQIYYISGSPNNNLNSNENNIGGIGNANNDGGNIENNLNSNQYNENNKIYNSEGGNINSNSNSNNDNNNNNNNNNGGFIESLNNNNDNSINNFNIESENSNNINSISIN